MFEVGQQVKVVQLIDEDLMDAETYQQYFNVIGATGVIADVDADRISDSIWFNVRFSPERLLEFIADELEAVDNV